MNPTVSSLKANALISLFEMGGSSAELRPILDKVRERGVNADIHNLAHVMWPLSKENLVTFLERKGTSAASARSGSVIVHISITDRGRERAQALLGLATGTVHKISGERGRLTGRAAHAVGRDQTDYRQHGKTALGGPIEVIKKENPMDHVPFTILSDEEAAKYRGIPSRANIKVSPVIDEEIAAETSPEGGEKAPEVAPISAATDTPTQYRESDTPREYPENKAAVKVNFFPDLFPHIAAVLAKRDKISRYQKAAELLGDDEAEIAIALLEKVKITPLEEEVIRLVG